MDFILGIFLLGLLALSVTLLVTAMNARSKKNELITHMKGLTSFTLGEHIAVANSAIGLDLHSAQIAVAIRQGEEVVCAAIPYSALTGVDLLRSEGASTKIKKIGFATFSTGGNVSSLTLAITTADARFPSLLVPLFSATGNQKFDDLNRASAFKLGNEWQAKLRAIVRMPKVGPLAVAGQDAVADEPQTRSSRPIAAELEALHRLLKNGALSEEEYMRAKTRLLGGG